MDTVLVAAGESPFLNSLAIAGGDTGSSRSTPLILDSSDWDEAPRVLGGTVRWKGGGELGRVNCGKTSEALLALAWAQKCKRREGGIL